MSDKKRNENASARHPSSGRRRPALPWQNPKDAAEDAEAPAKVRAILSSPSYRQADQDTEFLNRDDLRFVRLGLDYLKPELSLAHQGIEHTIVVFGSTRIKEPLAAERNVKDCRAKIKANPSDAEKRCRLRNAKRLLALSRYYDEARRFGELVGRNTNGTAQLVVMTGGGPGIMEAANRGASDAGAKSIGLNITLPHEQFPNPYITPDLCFRFHYFGLRKLHFMHRARALVAFPGGYGTIDELFDALTLIQTCKIKPIPIVLVGSSFWSRIIDFDFLVEEGVIDSEDVRLCSYAESADEIWQKIVDWHEGNGTLLYPAPEE